MRARACVRSVLVCTDREGGRERGRAGGGVRPLRTLYQYIPRVLRAPKFVVVGRCLRAAFAAVYGGLRRFTAGMVKGGMCRGPAAGSGVS